MNIHKQPREVRLHTGNERRRLGNGEKESWLSMLADGSRRGGVKGGLGSFAFPVRSSSLVSNILRGGVGFSELAEELSVCILSLSLSGSSKNIKL